MALETEKSEIKVLADLVPNERLPLPTLCPHTERSGGGGLWPLPLLGRMLIPLWGFALRTSSNTNDLPKAPPPDAIALDIKVVTYEFGGRVGRKHSVHDYKIIRGLL